MANPAEQRDFSKPAVVSPLTLLKAADRITDAFVSIDSSWIIVYINDTASRVFGLDERRVIGKDIRTFETPDMGLTFLPVYEEAMSRQQPMVMSAYYPGIDAWYENRIFPAPNGLSILLTDVTEEKRREKVSHAETDRINHLLTHDRLTGLFNRMFFEEEKDRLEAAGHRPVSIVVGDVNGLKRVNKVLGTSVGDDLLLVTARIFESCCRSTDIVSRIGGDEFAILLDGANEKAAASVLARITNAFETYNAGINNDLLRISISLGAATKSCPEISMEDVQRIADDRMCGSKLLDKRSMHSTVVASIKSTMVARSRETDEHAERLSALTRRLGEVLGLSPAELNELELFSALHDIGKIAISDRILNKPGDLTREEWTQMKKHPEIGFKIAQSSPDLASIAGYILTHHENWDGTGYPNSLSGEEIPLASRILAVADAYDAMTQDRVYRSAMSHADALDEIRRDSGYRFDPSVVEAFLRLVNG
jgi:diguanylate cyclase (GGDEF)-like protein/PAS domain S-box-containing protein